MIFLPVTDLIGQPYVGFKSASGQRGLENFAPTSCTLSQAKGWRSALQTRTDSALGTIMTNPEGIPNASWRCIFSILSTHFGPVTMPDDLRR